MQKKTGGYSSRLFPIIEECNAPWRLRKPEARCWSAQYALLAPAPGESAASPAHRAYLAGWSIAGRAPAFSLRVVSVFCSQSSAVAVSFR